MTYSTVLRKRQDGYFQVGLQLGPFSQWSWKNLKARRVDAAKMQAREALAELFYELAAKHLEESIRHAELNCSLILLGHSAMRGDLQPYVESRRRGQ